MADCTNNCSSCDVDGCSERKTPDFRAFLNEYSSVKKLIGVISGKGGVGKSLVTSLLAVQAASKGLKTAILDADITGPSIPKAFGLEGVPKLVEEKYMEPIRSRSGIDTMSVNYLLPSVTDPVAWRGPIIAGAVKQFWTDVIWKDEDVMFVDMPPGTGDVTLTVFQSLPVEGVVIVTSPQELVGMIVEKAVKMAGMMNIPVLGLVENMSYVKCPECGVIIRPFGESHLKRRALQYGIPYIAELPIDPELTSACDKGLIESFAGDYLKELCDNLLK
jgi:Mrp family chromosome partitioning ATPase